MAGIPGRRESGRSGGPYEMSRKPSRDPMRFSGRPPDSPRTVLDSYPSLRARRSIRIRDLAFPFHLPSLHDLRLPSG